MDIRAFESWRETNLPVEEGTAVQILGHTYGAQGAKEIKKRRSVRVTVRVNNQPLDTPIRHPEFISGFIYPNMHKVQRTNGC